MQQNACAIALHGRERSIYRTTCCEVEDSNPAHDTQVGQPSRSLPEEDKLVDMPSFEGGEGKAATGRRLAPPSRSWLTEKIDTRHFPKDLDL